MRSRISQYHRLNGNVAGFRFFVRNLGHHIITFYSPDCLIMSRDSYLHMFTAPYRMSGETHCKYICKSSIYNL